MEREMRGKREKGERKTNERGEKGRWKENCDESLKISRFELRTAKFKPFVENELISF
jgi:hypothetical protein